MTTSVNPVNSAGSSTPFLPKSVGSAQDSSFDQQLADALTKYLASGGFGAGKVRISVATGGFGQKTDVSTDSRQLLITLAPDSTTTSSSPDGSPAAATSSARSATAKSL